MKPNVLIRAAAAVARWQALRSLAAFKAGLAQAAAVQDRVLREIIAGSDQSRFGRDYGFPQIRNYGDFAKRVPILGYDQIEPYIEPIKQGDVTSLFNPGTKVQMLAMTSGTTGAVKYLPVTERYLRDYRRAWNAWGIALYDDHPDAWLRNIFQIASPMDEERTAGGLPCGAISGFIFAAQKRIVQKFYVVPPCVGYIKNAQAKYYTMMRLAIPRDVAMIATANPSTPLRLAQLAEQQSESLIRDVRDGTLRADLEVPAAIREQLKPLLERDSTAAGRLDALASSHGALLPKHYWNLGIMTNWTGGTVGLYVRQFPRYFGDVAVRDLGLVASEGRMSVPLEDATPSGALEIYGNFYEFVPVDQIDSPAPDVLRCHELAPGGEYFILLTTPGGLFRYHIGDVVRCDGFYQGGQAPLIRFLNKGRHVSSVTGEKLTEHQVVHAADRACSQLGLDLGDFVLCPRWADPPGYVLNIEAGRCPPPAWAGLAERLDAELARANIEYEQKRRSERLGPIAVELVEAGFFARMQDRHLRERHGRREQYKHQFLYTEVDADREFARPSSAVHDSEPKAQG